MESEINEKFDDLLKQKLSLEQENQELIVQLDHLETKFKDCEMVVEQEIKNASIAFYFKIYFFRYLHL